MFKEKSSWFVKENRVDDINIQVALIANSCVFITSVQHQTNLLKHFKHEIKQLCKCGWHATLCSEPFLLLLIKRSLNFDLFSPIKLIMFRILTNQMINIFGLSSRQWPKIMSLLFTRNQKQWMVLLFFPQGRWVNISSCRFWINIPSGSATMMISSCKMQD